MPLVMYWKHVKGAAHGSRVLAVKRFCKRKATEIIETGFGPTKQLCAKHAEKAKYMLSVCPACGQRGSHFPSCPIGKQKKEGDIK